MCTALAIGSSGSLVASGGNDQAVRVVLTRAMGGNGRNVQDRAATAGEDPMRQ